MGSVTFAFQADFAAEHAEEEGEVSEGENDSDRPPGDADGQAVMRGGRVVDGEVAGGVAARGQDDGIEREGCSHEHSDDVEGRADEGEFILRSADGVDHYAEAREDDERNQISDGILLVVVEDRRANVGGCDQAHNG